MRFVDATAVTPIGDDRYGVTLHQAYAIAGTKPNGGFQIACLARAALASAAAAGATQTSIVSAGAQYLRSPDVGPAEIAVDVLRVGRSATQVRARLSQDGQPAVDAKFVLGALSSAADPFWGGLPAPALPAIDDCQEPFPSFDGSPRAFDVRFDPETGMSWTPDGPVVKGGGEFRAWFIPTDEPIDSVAMLYASDALPPATFGVVQSGWVPTLDLTTYVRALPVDGPLRLRFRAQMIADGFADEICEAWDLADRLVFQSTQLVALRLP